MSVSKSQTADADLSSSLNNALRKYWGYSQFRPLQLQAINAVCAGQDALIVLPTGGGKSLCYQLPAICLGQAVVVSPLISLMQDQVAALRQMGVEAAFVNSSISGAEAASVLDQWRSGALKLLYVAPERLLMESFLGMLTNFPPFFFAIDEAHCISQWGHDFRFEYRRLSLLRETFPQVPICALTATATEVVRRDILSELKLSNAEVLVGDFDRPNLHYRAERRVNRRTQIEEILRAHKGKSGIIYAVARKDTESISEYLNSRGFRTEAYHAGLEVQTRRRVQQAFTNESLDAVVATVAFGMGIDRSNVRFVIHAALPASIEHYQQETGRAGRDGLPAECVLLFSAADIIKWRSIHESEPETPEDILEAKLRKLEEIKSFAYSRRCRHAFLAEYFGQKWSKGPCGNCDVCTDKPAEAVHPDSVVLAQKILSCIARLQERYGIQYVISVLRGETSKLQPVHCGLSTFGLLRDVSASDLRRWVEECLEQQVIDRSAGEYPVLRLTADGWNLLRGQKTIKLSMASTKSAQSTRSAKEERIQSHREKTAVSLSSEEQVAMEALLELRKRLAAEKKVPAYIIMPDSTLINIVRAAPTTPEELLSVSGMGEVKVRFYGEQILKTLNRSWQQDHFS